MLINQLNDIIEGIGFLSFEISLAAGALISLVVGLISKRTVVSQFVFVLVLLVSLFLIPQHIEDQFLFGDVLWIDNLGRIFKLLFIVTAVWIVFFPNAKNHPPEFYFLVIAILLGSSLMLSANQLLSIYLVVELTSFAAYIITNFNFRKQSFEAGMKYLIFGGVSSALALYGASLIYGFTGTLTLSEMNFDMVSQPALLNVGILLFAGSLFFKVSLVPFHIWVPTAYQEAPTDSVLVLSVIPKVAGFVLLHRVLTVVNVQELYWMYAIMVTLGVVTVVMGTLGALRQTNLKRLIAYGAIAHSGFFMAALLVPFEQGVTAFTWYAVVYAIMNLATFYLISVFETQGIDDLDGLSGYYKTDAYLGGLAVIVMISLIGLPPTAGFTAKFYLFTVMWDWYQRLSDPLMLTYLVVAMLSIVFSLFFYLKIPFQIFLKENIQSNPEKPTVIVKLFATIFVVALLWIFFTPEILNNIAENIKTIQW